MSTRLRHRRRDLVVTTMRIALVGLLLGPLGGCGGILSSPPHRDLYRVAPSFAFPARLPPVAAQLLVAMPSAPAGLDTRRIVLTRSPLSLDYYAEAEWTDRAPYLVQSALVDGFETSRAIAAVAPSGLGLHADFVLETAITDFEAAYDSPNGPPHVRVTLNVRLVRMPQRRILAQTSIGAVEAAAGNAIPDVVRAFDGALGHAVQEAVTWTLGNPALSRTPAPVQLRTRFVHPAGGHGK